MSSEILQKQKVFWEKLTGKLFCVRSIMRLKVVGSFREGGGGRGKRILNFCICSVFGFVQECLLARFRKKGPEKTLVYSRHLD